MHNPKSAIRNSLVMPHADNWDARYQAGDHAEADADPFLVRSLEYLDEFLPGRGRALDLAGGAGRNAVFLAALGFRVTLVDFSAAGLRKAGELAASRGVSVDLVHANLEAGEYQPAAGSFELATVFFYLERSLLPVIRRALAPGGLVIYRSYTADQLRFPGRPRHPAHFLRPNELLEAFRGFRVLFYEEVLKGKGVAGLVARKPS
jgi:SAM-dependent methyltransferase